MTKLILAAFQYENLKFYNNILTLRTLLWGLYGGFVIGIAVSFYNKNFVGSLIRTLLKKEALSPDSAQPLSKLKLKALSLLKFSLKHDSALKKLVKIANPQECVTYKKFAPFLTKVRLFFNKDAEKEIINFDKAILYIPEDLKYRADVLYDKKGSNPSSFIFLVIVLTAICVLVSYAIPELLTMLDNFLTMAARPE